MWYRENTRLGPLYASPLRGVHASVSSTSVRNRKILCGCLPGGLGLASRRDLPLWQLMSRLLGNSSSMLLAYFCLALAPLVSHADRCVPHVGPAALVASVVCYKGARD